MKNNKLLIAILLLLVAVAVYFFVSKSSGTFKNELNDFAVTDTASIDKIFISDFKGDRATLTRGDKYWVVDGSYMARQESVELLLYTFYRIEVKSPVAKAARNNVISDIATKTIKVEIYQGGDQPTKIYYIGGATQDNFGTYMVLESNGKKSSEPFITHIPGFYGYLSSRFFAKAFDWRDASIFKYQPEEIKSVEIVYHEKPMESFKIERNLNQLVLIDGETKKPIQNVDTNRIYQYLSFYDKIYYEMGVQDEFNNQQKDSIRNSPPFFTITVNDVYGKTTKIESRHIRNYKELVDDKGELYPYDLDRMFAVLNDDLLLYIQFHTFDKLTQPKQAFLK